MAQSVWSADFETTTKVDDCRVWSWGAVMVGFTIDFQKGKDIESFIDWAFKSPKIIYFHNLAFDASFILDYCMKNGWQWVKESPTKSQFTTLISNMGKFYSMTFIGKNGNKVEFRDSLKKFPMGVERLAKAFNMEVQKLSIDYEMERPVGYEPTKEEWDYQRADVEIVANALEIAESEGMTRLTIGADALAEYKKLSGRKFRRQFPELSPNLDAEIRKAYRGGWTIADSRFAGKLVGEGRVYDVNSLYPFVMHERPIPVGRPKVVDTLDDDALSIISLTFTAKIKPNHVPCIQIKRSMSFNPTDYQTIIEEPVTLTVTSVDLKLWMEHYDMNIISINQIYQFEKGIGLFNDYIDKWMEVKATSTGGRREIAKLHLNSLYGKLATNTDVTGKRPVLQNNRVILELMEHEERSPVYTPAGVFITAWARDYTIRSAQKNYDRFLYADTDSLHLLGTDDPEGLVVHGSDLGAWKHEGDFTEAVYVRAKQYSERMADGTVSTHIAGLPKDLASQVDVRDLLHDQEWHGKLIPTRVPGGVVLRPTTFKFTARKD